MSEILTLRKRTLALLEQIKLPDNRPVGTISNTTKEISLNEFDVKTSFGGRASIGVKDMQWSAGLSANEEGVFVWATLASGFLLTSDQIATLYYGNDEEKLSIAEEYGACIKGGRFNNPLSCLDQLSACRLSTGQFWMLPIVKLGIEECEEVFPQDVKMLSKYGVPNGIVDYLQAQAEEAEYDYDASLSMDAWGMWTNINDPGSDAFTPIYMIAQDNMIDNK